MLRIFGKVIPKLKLKLKNVDSIESIAIIHHVDKYCTDSLIEIELNVDESNALHHFSKPFKNIEHVTLEGPLPSIKRPTIPINQLFPAGRYRLKFQKHLRICEQ